MQGKNMLEGSLTIASCPVRPGLFRDQPSSPGRLMHNEAGGLAVAQGRADVGGGVASVPKEKGKGLLLSRWVCLFTA